MTVHGAKGLEFSHVFVLRVNKNKFPQAERAHVVESPPALMKEGAPEEQFHNQEERRLFYVALTRAEDRLTITALAEKKGRVPPFIEDILMEPGIQRRDVLQLAPKPVAIAPNGTKTSEAATATGSLFAPPIERPKIFSRIADWAETFLPACPEMLELEKTFALPVENNVILKGRIDQINSLGRKDVEIIDYKTGKPKKDSEVRRDLQLSIYAIAAKEIFELNPTRLVFHYLQDNSRQEIPRTTKQLDEALKIVQEVAADIRARSFPAKEGFICRSCAYRPICPVHEETLSETS